MALAPGPCTFSLGRLRRVWREGQPKLGQSHYDEYQYFDDGLDDKLRHPKAAKQIGLALFKSVQDPSNHISQLDASFQSFFLQPFRPTKATEAAVSLHFPMQMNIHPTCNVELVHIDTDVVFNTRWWRGLAACYVSCQLLQ